MPHRKIVIYSAVTLAAVLVMAIMLFRSRTSPIAVSERREPIVENLPRGLQLWAHRGLSVQHPENSLAAVRAAIAQGFCGVEIDIMWWKGRFVVTHDRPKPNDALLPLERVLAYMQGKHKYLWLDFKRMGQDGSQPVLAQLSRLLDAVELKPWTFVEAPSLSGLKRLNSAFPDIRTIFWVKPMAMGHDQRSPLNMTAANAARLDALFRTVGLNPTAVSFPIDTLRLSEGLDRLARPIFSWTYNSPDEIALAHSKGVRVALTDQPLRPSWRRFACPPSVPDAATRSGSPPEKASRGDGAARR